METVRKYKVLKRVWNFIGFLPDEIRTERTLERFCFGEKQQLFRH